jgi:hypothetical protein
MPVIGFLAGGIERTGLPIITAYKQLSWRPPLDHRVDAVPKEFLGAITQELHLGRRFQATTTGAPPDQRDVTGFDDHRSTKRVD